MNTEEKRKELERICGELDFPDEGTRAMLEAWDAVSGCPGAEQIFEKWIAAYGQDIHMDYKKALTEADGAAKEAKIHPYTARLLLFLCLCEPLKQRYL